MRIPKLPPVGFLIAFEYLWLSQQSHREDGEKTYPCAVVLRRDDLGPVPLAYVLGMSHSAPLAERRAMPVPMKLKRHLGLDREPSWLYTDEVNVFAWPGSDLRPASRLSSRPNLNDTCVIEALPTDWFDEVTSHVAESHALARLKTVRRT